MTIRTSPNIPGFLSTRGIYTLTVLLAVFVGLLLAPEPYLLGGPDHFVSLHTMLEVGAIVVAVMVFAIGWRSWLNAPPLPVTIIACGFLGVGLLDLGHLLSYQGMPDLVTPNTAAKAINFWLAARLLAGVSLLCAIALSWQRSSTRGFRNRVLLGSLILVGGIATLFLIYPERLPQTFIPGKGLTTFKVAAEYVIVAIYLASAVLLWFRRPWIQDADVPSLSLAILISVLSELFFTLYADVTDLYNFMGHIYKIIAYYFLYRALVVSGIERPNRRLAAAERRMAATLEAMPDMMFEIDKSGTIHQYHSQRETPLVEVRQMLGANIL